MAALSKLAALPLQLLASMAAFANPTTMTLRRFRWLCLWFLLAFNLKSLPLYWHSRFYRALFHHLLFRRQKLPTPAHLFAPVVTSSRSPIYECDFNLHKSNSTYFSDLDIARTHLVTHLIKKSLRVRRQRGEKPMYVALAGVICLFRREIKPYEKYEMWIRVLGWDSKWLYVVGHFVSPVIDKKTGERKVFASSLSKYVFKSERRTILPTVVLEEAGLLPPRPTPTIHEPGDAIKDSFGEESLLGMGDSILHNRLQHLSSANASTRDPSPAPGGGNGGGSKSPPENVGTGGEGYATANEVPQLGADRVDVWDWETVEKVRLHGLAIANNMLRLDALEAEFAEGNGRSGINGKAPLTF